MMVDSRYKDNKGNIWVCKARGMSFNKERFAMFVNTEGAVWFTTEPDWGLFEEFKKRH